LRILYFTDTYRTGGAERFLADLVAGVADVGHDVTVASPQASVLELIRATAPGVELLQTQTDYSAAPSWQEQLRALMRSVPELRSMLLRLRPEILHVNNGGHPGSDLNRLATIVSRISAKPKCVLTINSAASPRSQSQPQLQALSDWLMWHSVDVVHSATVFQARSMSSRSMPIGLSRVIPYGVPESEGWTQQVAELRTRLAPAGGLLVGIVSATGEPEKGHAVLVQALARAKTDARTVVVGHHPGDSFVQLIDRLGLKERIYLEGAVPAVGPYLHAIDLLVVPSTAYESLPLVVLEAMAAGKPVFASRLSGIPEAVIDAETGRLFEPGNVEELSALLREAAGDPATLQELGRAGRARWAERFSLEAMTERMLALYAELVPAI
jgi:glycosyltransferase involved in cell wall biosynthesis